MPTFEEDMTQVIERVQKLVTAVPVARNLDRPHGAIARLLGEDERRRQKHQASPYRWDAPQFASPFEMRRLRIINALFLGLQRYGCHPWVRDRNARDLGVEVGHQNVGFELDALAPHPQPPRLGLLTPVKPSASDKLKLTIHAWDPKGEPTRKWVDTDEAKLEHHVRDIVVELMVIGEAHYRTGTVERHEWLIQRREAVAAEVRRRREEHERRERERQAKLEQERLDRLFAAAGNWRRAADLRAFVDAVREAYGETESPEDAERLDQWTADALEAADRLDPLRRGQFALEIGKRIPASQSLEQSGAS